MIEATADSTGENSEQCGLNDEIADIPTNVGLIIYDIRNYSYRNGDTCQRATMHNAPCARGALELREHWNFMLVPVTWPCPKGLGH